MLRLEKLRVLAVMCLLGCLAVPAGAQGDGPVFHSDARLVVLHATVVDENGRLTTDLPKDAFHVFENGVAQELKVFRREDTPVSMGLVIDDSASMLVKRERVKSASLALVQASNPDDEVFLVNFSDRPYLDTDFTNNIANLEEGLGRIQSRGTTAMRDAVRLAMEHLRRKGREDKKVLLVISDGEDNTSIVPLDWLVREAQQNGVLIYAVGLLSDNSPQEAARARRELDALTQATGGHAWYLENLSEIAQAARRIAHDLRNQYTLAYTPSNQSLDGTYREIRVAVDSPRPLTVRTRTGYYATPERSQAATASRPGE